MATMASLMSQSVALFISSEKRRCLSIFSGLKEIFAEISCGDWFGSFTSIQPSHSSPPRSPRGAASPASPTYSPGRAAGRVAAGLSSCERPFPSQPTFSLLCFPRPQPCAVQDANDQNLVLLDNIEDQIRITANRCHAHPRLVAECRRLRVGGNARDRGLDSRANLGRCLRIAFNQIGENVAKIGRCGRAVANSHAVRRKRLNSSAISSSLAKRPCRASSRPCLLY